MASAVTRALVVGGTSGVGYGIACRVASESASGTVIISGRNKPASIPHANIEFRALDASSMRSIREYADAYKTGAGGNKIDLLVLSQGIMTTAGRTETAQEGIDLKMALHYYGRQALIRELEPVLAPDAKVLVVLDGTRGDLGKLDWDDLDLAKPGSYSVRTAADHCVTMTDGIVQHHAAEQQRQQKDGGDGDGDGSAGRRRRHFVHAYPGLVQTNLGHQQPWYIRYPMAGLMKVGGVSADTCAENLVRGLYEVAAPAGEGEGAEEQGRFWSCIDAKGSLVKGKQVWTEEQRKKLAEHTWGIIDAAMAVPK
ncbi:SDR family oxidoreductase [Microdochium nivale]|nr:SDR family oxidoreductase [Microdochium nivale]